LFALLFVEHLVKLVVGFLLEGFELLLLAIVQTEHFHHEGGQNLSWSAKRAHTTSRTTRPTKSAPATPFHSASALATTFPSAFATTPASLGPSLTTSLGTGERGFLSLEGA
jgi:hypothetical protein